MPDVQFDEVLGRTDDNRTKVDMLIYGRSGAGKTFRAATAPGPYVMSPDPTGHKSIPYPIGGKLIKRIQDANDVLDRFEQGYYEGKVETLIVDGVSFFYNMWEREMGEYYMQYRGAKDPDQLPIDARGKINKRFREFLTRCVNLTQIDPPERRVHVICTTLEERLKESDEAPFSIRPLFGSQNMNLNYPALFTVISYIFPVGEDSEGNPSKQRSMIFTEYRKVLARDRLGIFPELCSEAPNLEEYLS